ncbi:sugar ABC transporter substrate-binding protein [bacterium]|nr:MAG: sugar ABC transporter substrate-binding protein [bacterium]
MKDLSLLVAVLGFLGGCNSPESGSTGGGTVGSAGSEPTIAVIPKGTTHAFWKAVESGAKAAGKDLGAKILWKGPLKEDDRAGQIAIVQQFAADKVSAIVLAPLDDQALVAPVQAATAKGVPVVIVDSGLKGEAGKDFVSFIATDNRHAGELGGERLGKLLNGKGKVVLLRYMVGSASTMAREAGFLDAMKKFPGITVISQNQYAGSTQSEAQTKAMQMVDTLKQADGIFTPNESSTLGVVQALAQNGLTGKLKFVGFDATPELIECLEKGTVDALVAQNPVKMGYEGVKAAIEKIKGKSVAPSMDTGVAVIDKENLHSAEIQKLLAGQ